jgi:hypothetical protein
MKGLTSSATRAESTWPNCPLFVEVSSLQPVVFWLSWPDGEVKWRDSTARSLG